jgi:hypothetical protein
MPLSLKCRVILNPLAIRGSASKAAVAFHGAEIPADLSLAYASPNPNIPINLTVLLLYLHLDLFVRLQPTIERLISILLCNRLGSFQQGRLYVRLE